MKIEELPPPKPRDVTSARERWERNRVVQIAQSWIGTPYHHEGRRKGAGVDCATLLAEVYREAGFIPHLDLPHYSPQWHIHRREEKLIAILEAVAIESKRTIPLPGDVVCWKFYKLFAHGSIAGIWPRLIHSHIGSGRVEEEDISSAVWLSHISEKVEDQGKPRPFKIFTFWPERT